jgi:hypothetical protein
MSGSGNWLTIVDVRAREERQQIVHSRTSVCTKNLVRIDCVTESPNVNGDDRALLALPDPIRLAIQVKEPT